MQAATFDLSIVCIVLVTCKLLKVCDALVRYLEVRIS